ncbi:MAG: trehalose-phosphatase [Actinobacteria bacterium]|nr:trehalose-phosphatase [Actinomycetota bacterium]
MSDGQLITKGETELDACLAVFAAAPRAGALLCDIDGTISAIVARPGDAAVSQCFLEALAALTERLGLVAFVTGRTLEDGRRMIPLDGAAYVGTHGLEVMAPGGQIHTEPQTERYIVEVQEVAAAAARDLDCEALGVVLEDKRTVLAIHYRLATDAARTRHEILTKIVEPARGRGLAISTGHFLFEVRPPLPFNKGTATRRLLAGGDYLAGMFCGDDLTDVTGFKSLHEWAARDARRAACAVAAVTAETPSPVIEGADVLVRATPGIYEALTRLLAAVGG